MHSEDKRVVAEVKKRKQRAWQSGVVQNAFDIYRENLPHSDVGTTNCPHLIGVTNRIKTTAGGESSERIEATILGNAYVFTFREYCTPMDGGVIMTGHLDVEYQGRLVMRIDCRYEDDRYAGTSWIPMDVSVFLEGPWVADLTSVSADIKHSREQLNKLARRESKRHELDNLKKNFGLAQEKGFLGAVRSIIHRLLRT